MLIPVYVHVDWLFTCRLVMSMQTEKEMNQPYPQYESEKQKSILSYLVVNKYMSDRFGVVVVNLHNSNGK